MGRQIPQVLSRTEGAAGVAGIDDLKGDERGEGIHFND